MSRSTDAQLPFLPPSQESNNWIAFTVDFTDRPILALFSVQEIATQIFSFLSNQESFKNATLTSRLFAAYRNPEISYYDPKDIKRFSERKTYKRQELHPIALPDYHCFAAISSDANRIISIHKCVTWNFSDQKIFMVWDTKTGFLLKTINCHNGGVSHVAFSPDGKKIAAITDKSLRFYDGETYHYLGQLISAAGDEVEIKHIVFSPDNKKFVTTGYPWDSRFRVWDANTYLPLFYYSCIITKTIFRVIFSLDGANIILSPDDKPILFFDSKTYQHLHTVEMPRGTHCIDTLVYDGVSTKIICKMMSGGFQIYDIKSGQFLRQHDSNIRFCLTHVIKNQISFYSSWKDRSLTRYILGVNFMNIPPIKAVEPPPESSRNSGRASSNFFQEKTVESSEELEKGVLPKLAHKILI